MPYATITPPQITAVSIGPKASAETLRTALAMGADNAIHLETDMRLDQELQPLAVAKLLAWISRERKPDLWILGKQVRIGGVCVVTAAALMRFVRITHAPFSPLLDYTNYNRRLTMTATRRARCWRAY